MSGVTLTAGSYDVIEDDALKCALRIWISSLP